ncbi:MAG: thiamine pyrophosphate protein binding domain protein [Propionibacteriaceae bacterium]|jgi:pyruvate dehydrogenase (quinone)|nr:thiamine pyrophosphate protein binding domain protein [Propionibacteriaceae bacterium]
MTQPTVADLLVRRLKTWGVDRVFGYSGDGINPFMGALRRAAEEIEFVQARHEENAALMAVGHAKYSGHVGVVTSTQGPGAVHLLNGLYDAKLDSVPVVAIVGQQETSVLGSQYQQEVDLAAVFADVASSFAEEVVSADQLPMVIDRAFRAALTDRAPTVIIIPHDVQQEPAPEPEQQHGVHVTAAVWRPAVPVPLPDDLAAAAAVLNAGRRVALLVGQGARAAQPEVVQIAEKLGAGITTSLLGKPYVDETSPIAAGTMGHLGTTASAFVLGECDTLLIIGSNDPWTEFYPPPGAARAVQIDADPAAIGNRYPVEVPLVGDAAPTVQALLPLLTERGQDSSGLDSWRPEVERQVQRWRRITTQRALTPANPVNPERVVYELNQQLPADAQLAVDVGSCVYWYARQLQLPPGVPAHLSSTLATMGCSIPYAIAAKLLHPERPMVVLSGDGAMQMAGVNELITVSRLWPRWPDPRFVVCVINNGDLAEVSWEQREMESEPRFAASQALPSFPYARYGELLGLGSITVKDPEQVANAWQQALSADRPVVLEVITDPDIPLLPPFPAGESKLSSFEDGLGQEGNSHARDLLRTYAAYERA